MSPGPALLVVATSQVVTATVLLAQDAVASPEASSVSTAIAAVAQLGAVAALAYIARAFATGRLVHRDPATVEAQLMKVVEQLTEQNDRVSQIAEDYRSLLLQDRRERPPGT